MVMGVTSNLKFNMAIPPFLTTTANTGEKPAKHAKVKRVSITIHINIMKSVRRLTQIFTDYYGLLIPISALTCENQRTFNF